MEDEQIKALLERCMAVPDGAPLLPDDDSALRSLLDSDSCCYIVPLLLLRHGAGDEAALRHRLMLAAPDRRTALFAAYGEEWASFYPDSPQAPPQETNNVIDTFLSTYGSCTPEEEAVLERMIFNPTPDYGELLAREEAENLPSESVEETDPQQARINAFILSRHPAATHAPDLMPEPPTPEETALGQSHPVSAPEPTDDTLLSESLARIFIKRGRYERAYEIISGLNLKFPKKSAYFADQLRFLQKLIVNQRRFDELNEAGGEK